MSILRENERESMQEYESLPKKPKLVDIEAEAEAGRHSLTPEAAVEESALKTIILENCSYSLELCKQLSDELYRSVLDGSALLAYLLNDKEELNKICYPRMLYDQMNKFWDQLARFGHKGHSLNDVCKLIASKNVDWDEYSLLNECNLARMLMYCHHNSYFKPFTGEMSRGLKIEKTPFDGDIEEAIRKAKRHPRLTVKEYTSLLLEMFREDLSLGNEERLLAKAVDCIDFKALNSLEADAIKDVTRRYIGPSSSAHEELEWIIRVDLMKLVYDIKGMFNNTSTASSTLFACWMFDGVFTDSDLDAIRLTSAPPLGVDELISIAELRRKAEGRRFINRDHILWAFDERGCGLYAAFKDELLVSRMGAEDQPPYYIYDIVLRLARAEYVCPDINHLAFAVVFGRGLFAKKDKELQEDFNRFKNAMCGVIKPKDLMMSGET